MVGQSSSTAGRRLNPKENHRHKSASDHRDLFAMSLPCHANIFL